MADCRVAPSCSKRFAPAARKPVSRNPISNHSNPYTRRLGAVGILHAVEQPDLPLVETVHCAARSTSAGAKVEDVGSPEGGSYEGKNVKQRRTSLYVIISGPDCEFSVDRECAAVGRRAVTA